MRKQDELVREAQPFFIVHKLDGASHLLCGRRCEYVARNGGYRPTEGRGSMYKVWMGAQIRKISAGDKNIDLPARMPSPTKPAWAGSWPAPELNGKWNRYVKSNV